MKAQDLRRPTVPVVYGDLILEVALEHGVAREQVLAGLDIPERIWGSPDARLSLVQVSGMLYRALQLSGNPGFGYEIGLHSTLTSHGFVGLGLMAFPTLREAFEFGSRYLPLRLPNLQLSLHTEAPIAAVEVSETTPQGAVRQAIFDLFLVGVWRISLEVLGLREGDSRVELWFDYPQPPYYARYASRLPPARFAMGSTQLRFPAGYLDRSLRCANPNTAALVQQQCARELELLGFGEDFLRRVREAMVKPRGGYRSLEEVAAHLFLSSRTLKRKLHDHDVSFQQLLDEMRQHDSMLLLRDSSLKVEEVALRVSYTDPANFTRAFRKWTGVSPSEFRARLESNGEGIRP
ncbi:MAG: AraC family transcriptional regulator [Nevskia sp.]|nr:AraC family transcriptional regulator [Nevskia sp.]